MTEQHLPTSYEDILAQCLDALQHDGVSVASCLARYPEYAEQLKQPLMAAVLLQKLQLPAMRPESVQRLSAHLRQQSSPRTTVAKPITRPTFWGELSRLAAALAVVLFVTFAGAGVTVAASANSMPDEALYEVKIAWEKVILFFAELLDMAGEMWLHLAQVRLEEMEYLQAQGLLTPEQFSVLEEAVQNALSLANDASTQARTEAFARTLEARIAVFPPIVRNSAPYTQLMQRIGAQDAPEPEPTVVMPTATATQPPTETPTTTPTETPRPTETTIVATIATNTPRYSATPTCTPTPLMIVAETDAPTLTWTPSATFTWTPLPILGLTLTPTLTPTRQTNAPVIPPTHTPAPSGGNQSPFVRETLQAAALTQTAEAIVTEEAKP